MDRQGSVEQAVRKIALEICEDKGLELFDVVYQTSGGGSVLKIFIDAPEGISAEDCKKVSKELSTRLDVEDPITGKYTLEVSSPGLERPIRHLEDAMKYVGKKVKVTSVPIDERKHFTGILEQVVDDSIIINLDDTRFTIPWEKIRKAHLVFEF